LRRGFCALLSREAKKTSIESSVGARSWSIEISRQTQSYPGGRAGSAELVVPVAFAGGLVSRYHISIEQEPNLRADCYM
jgi:pSer/pThr/pTyr-binding forkhead associated (FHA) protein